MPVAQKPSHRRLVMAAVTWLHSKKRQALLGLHSSLGPVQLQHGPESK